MLYLELFDKKGKFIKLTKRESSSFISYENISKDILRAVSFLEYKGFKRGDSVILITDVHYSFFILLYALEAMEITTTILFDSLSKEDIYREKANKNVKYIFCCEDLEFIDSNVITYENFLLNIDSFKTADISTLNRNSEFDYLILKSSGTSGEPKDIVLTSKNIKSSFAFYDSYNIKKGNLFVTPLPLGHIYGLFFSAFLPIYFGASVSLYYVSKKNTKLSQLCIKRALKEAMLFGKVTTLVPRIYKALLSAKMPFFTKFFLKTVNIFRNSHFTSGGEDLPNYLAKDVKREFGIDIVQGYGSAESVASISANGFKINKIGTVGKIYKGLDYRVDDDGELWLKGSSISKSAIDSDGWYRTGDIVKFDKYHMKIIDRKRDIIIVNGENIGSVEIENSVKERFSEIENAIALSGFDKSEYIALFISFKKPLESFESKIKALDIQGFRVKRVIEIREENIPRTDTGKIKKYLLRELLK